MFGSTTPSNTGTLSFGGGAAATASPFGAPATPSTFGNPSTGTLSFGGGATTTGAGAFGAPSSSFGATATPAFGAPSSAASTGSFSFGGTPTATTPGSFSFSTPAPATAAPAAGAFSGFGAPQQPAAIAAQNPMAPLNARAVAAPRTPERSIQEIMLAFHPDSPYCRFQHMFYNLVDPGEAARYQKPANVNDQLWKRAVQDNPCPERLVPVQATGFDDLKKRIEAQTNTTEEHKKAIEAVGKIVTQLKQRHELNTTVKVDEYRRRHLAHKHRLLRIMKKLEVVRSRGYSIFPDEEAFRMKLENLQRELNNPTQFKGRLNELTSLVRMQEDVPQPQYEGLDEDVLDDFQRFLTQQQEGLSHLSTFLKSDSTNVGTMLHELEAPQPHH